MASFGKFLIWYGVVFGILDWLSDIVYVQTKQIDDPSFQNACKAFILLQPIWYFFLHFVYMASQAHSPTDKVKLVLLSPVYAALQYLKVLSAFPSVHRWFTNRQGGNALPLTTLENSFKVQVFTECLLETIPQMIIQVTINNA